MTTLAAPVLMGSQVPTFHVAPPYVSSAGPEVVKLAKRAGLDLDPWQALELQDALGERADGMWAAFEVAEVLARQNGKGGVLEARVLGGLFLLGERLIMYSAHEFKTAQEMFKRIEALIAGTPEFSRRVKMVSRSKGDEGIELLPTKQCPRGQRLRFLARSNGSGRGFTGDCNIWDESQNLAEASVDALMPTMSAVLNPQLWYAGSAPDKDLAPCDQIARVRRRAKSGKARRLAYSEWCADLCTEMCKKDCDQHDDPADPKVWAKTNPALGIRISEEFVAGEHESMSAKGFARERLSFGNWPTEGAAWEVIPEDVWTSLLSPGQIEGVVALAIDMTPDRSYTSIGLAGRRADGRLQVEVIDHEHGNDWVVARVKDLKAKWQFCAVVIDPAGPAGTLIKPLEDAGIEVIQVTAREAAYAAQGLYDACTTDDLAHLDDPILSAAVAGAIKRPLADAWAWNRRGVSVVISPLVAVSLAAWGHANYSNVTEDEVEPWAVYL